MSHRTVAAAVTAGVALSAGIAGPAAAHASARCPLPVVKTGARFAPHVHAGRDSARVTNPYFPLRVGRVLVYAGAKDGTPTVDVVVATRRTVRINEVRTRAVEDRLYEAGRLAERTTDYYGQDRCGNVWYFGEDTAELDTSGRVVSTEGSFRAGVKGAQPGVIMPAHPRPGPWIRQEWFPGQAEDTFRVVSRRAHVTVPFGTFSGAVRTHERTALEPGVLDEKVYVRGVGEVLERTVRGARETAALVEVLN
jgi:hypothetical protein